MKKYFVTAISTDSGKTVVSAILTNALQADYWKPVQAGTELTDSNTIKALLRSNKSIIHEESYLLNLAASPHLSAKVQNTYIDMNAIQLPDTKGNDLIIEGAGGILVPLNETDCVADLIQQLDAEIILISNHYLGSINHTLLTAQELKRRNIYVKGIVFNGSLNEESERIILHKTGYRFLLRILPETVITKETIEKYEQTILNNWYE
jgi:dethiobiotin synthetase